MRHDIDSGASTTTPITAAGPVAQAATPQTIPAAGDFSLYLTCLSLTPAGATARIAIQDSANGTFSDALDLWVEHFQGAIGGTVQGTGANASDPIAESRRAYQLTNASRGGTLRVNVLALSAGASLSLHAQADY